MQQYMTANAVRICLKKATKFFMLTVLIQVTILPEICLRAVKIKSAKKAREIILLPMNRKNPTVRNQRFDAALNTSSDS